MKKLTVLLTFALVAAVAGVLLAADQVMVAQGTVVSSTPDTIIVNADNGQQVFVLNSDTLHPQVIPVESGVTVKYRDDGFGNLYATNIVVHEELDPMVEVTTEVGEPVAAAQGEPMESQQAEPEAEPLEASPVSEEPLADLEADTAAAGDLPNTASPLPLLLLLGAGALGTGLMLRRRA